MKRPRIVLADDFQPLADACKRVLEAEFEVVAIVSSGEAASDAVRDQDPDVLVLAISMKGLSSIELVKSLVRAGSRTRAVMLGFDRHPAVIRTALATGALGYVAKTRLERDLRPAVRAALAGERFLSPAPDRGSTAPDRP